ncbi:MAG: hypothetical protein CFE46_14565 [Burkholderiales bacterium PBB6]|nr:MAG: hypothetical protein CFE46_14565 [Burkholderiales bacterium PBB6]
MRVAVAAVLPDGVDHQIALVVLGIQLPEARLVDLEAGVTAVVGGLKHQIAIGHVEHARGVTHRMAHQAVAGAAGGPCVGHADVAAVGVIGQAPGAGGHGANAHAAPVFVAERDVAVVPEAGDVDRAVTQALAQQA